MRICPHVCTVFLSTSVLFHMLSAPPELPQQNVCKEKEEEVFTDQKLCKQNSSLDQEDTKPPEIKEEQEEEQLVLKQECDTFMLTPTSEENDHNQDETLYLIINRSGGEENPQSFILVESSVASEPNSDHQLLSHNCRVTERQDQEGSKSTDSETTRHAESKTMKHESQSNFGYNCNMSEILRHTHTGKKTFLCDIYRNDFSASPNCMLTRYSILIRRHSFWIC